ncbi:metal-dependent transcriptional regulator [Tannockella kyphosi]|uniref:metal-dependent transcriptional regulator n=1 Tax=Tannockella kyphosi TaxID=2899121 RepID=UPI0020113F65|nr:metal-dependent transcriptional regulator [Tannockella kyphosi]
MYESGEMYLETILLLQKKNEYVRSIDIARHLEFSKPSVSRGVGILKKEGYILIDESGHISLSEKGYNKANNILEKHYILTQFLIATAKVTAEIAEEDACKMEHIVSDETLMGIKEFLKAMQKDV